MNAVWHNKNEKELKKRKMACSKVRIPREIIMRILISKLKIKLKMNKTIWIGGKCHCESFWETSIKIHLLEI